MAEIGRFLRARRARIAPEAAGLRPGGGRRRVPGLRREELARLAGVSTEYYVRLEQGRATRASDAVLTAVGRALRLSTAEQEHLVRLARPDDVRRGRPGPPERVGTGVQRLLDAVDDLPMYVVGRRTEVIRWNTAADAVYGFAADAPRPNIARRLFLDPAVRARYPDWPTLAAAVVSRLRLEVGEFPDDPLLTDLVARLVAADRHFARLWATQHLEPRPSGVLTLHHPVAGELVLSFQAVTFPQDPGLTAVVDVPVGGSVERLRDLVRRHRAGPPHRPVAPSGPEPSAGSPGRVDHRARRGPAG